MPIDSAIFCVLWGVFDKQYLHSETIKNYNVHVKKKVVERCLNSFGGFERQFGENLRRKSDVKKNARIS